MLSTPTDDLSGDYVLDTAHTRLGFVARHAVVARVHGSFERFHGGAHVDAGHPSRSSVSVDIEAGSVTTGVKQRDAHLRTSDFLDVPHHPLITFRSTEVSRPRTFLFRVLGDLTIRGITRPLPLEFQYRGSAVEDTGEDRHLFTASTVISRNAWGVSWSAPVEAGGLLVADLVTLELRVSALRLAAAEGGDSLTPGAVASGGVESPGARASRP